MTAASFLRDISAFSVQVALVGLGLAMLLKLVKLPAGVRYTGLRLALVASLVAPWLLRTPEVQAPALAKLVMPAVSQAPFSTTDASTTFSAGATGSVATAPEPAIPWLQVGFGALLIGIVARVMWLGMGVLRLLRLKREGVVVDAPEYSELQQQLGTRATIAQVAALPQPATFGVRRPIVLLPDTLAAASSSLRRAVVAHELFHVRRRDWLSVLAEEAVRTALWFHPAILWMTSQIQLAREELVDELTVQATGDRRTYVEALLAFADTPGLSPAPAFAQRRQLFHRILSVSKEKAMSRPRMLSSAAVLLTAVVGASWYASTLFPILKAAKADVQAPAPSAGDVQSTESDWRLVLGRNVVLRTGEVTARAAEVRFEQQTGNVLAVRPITPENPIPRRTRGVAPVTPSQYASAQVVVSTRVTVDRDGAVTAVVRDACSVSDGRNNDNPVCAAFFDSVSAAIRQWRYDRPAQGPIQFYVNVTFRPGGEPTVTQSSESWASSVRETQDSLRALADQQRDIATLRRAVEARGQASRGDDRVATDDFLKAQLAELTARFRELERAQRLAVERLRPEHPDLRALQQQLARLNAEMASTEAELRNNRQSQLNTNDQARNEEQIRAATELLRESERQLRLNEARVDATRAEEVRAAREAANALRGAADGDALARAQAQALTEQLREAERRLEAYRAQRSASVDGSQQLRSPSGRTPIRVTDVPGMKPPTVRKNVKPEHPLAAVKARVEGTVVLETLVDEQGRVADVRVTKSIPLLDQAAIEAARQWEFTPTLMNGEPVPVLLMLEMNFTLK